MLKLRNPVLGYLVFGALSCSGPEWSLLTWRGGSGGDRSMSRLHSCDVSDVCSALVHKHSSMRTKETKFCPPIREEGRGQP